MRECAVGFPSIKDHANLKRGRDSQRVYSCTHLRTAQACNIQMEVKLVGSIKVKVKVHLMPFSGLHNIHSMIFYMYSLQQKQT